MNKTNDFKYNLPAYSDPVDIEDLNDNFRGIDDALMAGLCKKDYTGNNMGSSDPSARKYAWAPWLEIVNDNEFDVVVADRNAPVESEEATINIAAGQTFRKYINGRYYMNFYVQDQHDVTFKWFTNAETYINESGGGGGTGTVTSVSVQGGSGSHLTGSGNPIETSGTITINVDDGYSIPSDNEQTAWDGKAADLKAEIDSSTYVLTLQLKDSAGNLIGTAKTIDLPLETMVVDGEYDSQTKKIKLELKNGNYVEFSVADLVSGLQTELSASNKLDPDYIDYDSNHRAVSDTEKNTWNGKQNAIDSEHKLSSSLVSFTTAEAAALASGIDSAKVAQISTNQSNILYALKTGANNLLDLSNATMAVASSLTVTKDGNSYVISGNPSSNASVTFTGFPVITSTSGSKIAIVGCPAGGSTSNGYSLRGLYNGTWKCTDTGSTTKEFITGSIDTISMYFNAGQYTNVRFTPMVVSEEVWNTLGSDYMPPALPNYDLTQLEAEDRAALAEVVDSGAKQLIPYNLSILKSNNTLGTWGNNVYTYNSVTFTVNSDDSISVNRSAIGASGVSFRLATNAAFSPGTYVLSAGSGTLPQDWTLSIDWSDNTHTYATSGTNPTTFTLTATKTGNIYIWVSTPSGSFTYKPMICTKAAFGVSKAFVPYRPNYDLVGSTTNALLATAYNTVTPVNNYVTNIEGGYIRIGNLVVVNVKCTVNTNIPGSTPFIDGLPKPIINYNTGFGGASVVNNKNYSLQVIGTGSIAYAASSESIPSATTLVMNCTYFTK